MYQQFDWHGSATSQRLPKTVQGFLECTSDCVFILDPSWRFSYLNRRAREEIARNDEDLIGKVIWEAFPDSLGSTFEEQYRRAIEFREEVSFESYFEPHSAWYEVRASPTSGGGLGVWFRNVNERRKSVAALTAADERFKLAARATRDVIFDWDIASGSIEWQDAHNRFLGYASDEIEADISWVMSRVHPDDRERLAKYSRRVISGAGSHFACDYRMAKKDGSYADVFVRGFLTRSEGKRALRMVGAVQDNTERNSAARVLSEREAHLSSIFGQAMVGIMHRGPDGKTIMINDRFCEILGRSREELLALNFSDYTHPDDLSWNLPLHRQKSEAREPFQIEKRYVRPDGSSVWCQVNVSFLGGDDSVGPDAIVVAQDVTARKCAEEALGRQSALLQTVVDSVADLIFVRDREGRFVLTNRALTEGCGTLLGMRTGDFFPDELVGTYESVDKEVIAWGGMRTVEETIPIKGQRRLFETIKVPWVEHGEIAGVIGVSRDITDNKANELVLRDSEMLYRSVLEASADCIEILDLDGTVRLANSTALSALNLDSIDQVRGQLWISNWPAVSRATAAAALEKAREGATFRFSTVSQYSQSGARWWDVVVSPMCDENGNPTGILSISRDTTFQRETSAKLEWASEHDSLTGLANRRAFQTRLQAATIRAMNSSGSVGLLLIDLDHFKHINDTLGHTAGDHLLTEFGQRLRRVLRAEDFIARLGGDEFAVIIEGELDATTMAATGAAIVSRLQEPVKFEGRVLSANASLGGAIFPNDAANANELFDNADIALYALKASGRGGTRMFERPMRDHAQVVSSQLSLARVSISERAIEPFYQQKVDLQSGQIAGFEALLRWRHAHRGIQLPGAVAEAFKDYELASKISEQIQHRVFADVREWAAQRLPFGRVSVNAAPVEFLRDDFAERMLERMRAHGVMPQLIELEVTEHVFLESGSTYVGRALKLLHEAGTRIALDDFGTGYSSLSHLRDFPVDVVKIDRSFVEGMARNSEMMAIVSAVIDLAANLKIEVVAEGVESEEQKTLLASRGCPLGQGFLFGPAIDASHVPKLFGRPKAGRAMTYAA